MDRDRAQGGIPVQCKARFADLHGNTVVLGFWDPRRMCVFNVCVVGIDTASYNGIHPHKILSQHEQRKRGEYIEACLELRRHFLPLVLSVDGVVVEETKAATKQLASAL